MNLFLATIAEDAADMAVRHQTGLEIDEYCTAENMDNATYDSVVASKAACADRIILHAPFSELFPCAIDPLAVRLAERRFAQAAEIAHGLNAELMVVHSGFIPLVYFPEWFHDRSVDFWRRFLDAHPDTPRIAVENVLEDTPDCLAQTISDIGDERIGLCLDIGHAFVQSARPLNDWIDAFAPHLVHVHLHDNDGLQDRHLPLGEGRIDMDAVLRRLSQRAPKATLTLENMRCEPSLEWLKQRGWM